jgi:formylglycine-generating enzyme required for sulfatase activity
MIAIPGGTFQMGSNDYADTKPLHVVTLSSFHIGKFQISQAHWLTVMGSLPNVGFRGENLPVERVSWYDVVDFCEKLSKQTGKKYRLPTEAEWEYACRAGSTGRYCFGDNEVLLNEYAWSYKNSHNKTHPVGQLKPNDWRLYDMHGNVWEWCQDWYNKNYYDRSPKKNPKGPSSGTYRVLRGGSWGGYTSLDCNSACRDPVVPDSQYHDVGFRVVCVVRTS